MVGVTSLSLALLTTFQPTCQSPVTHAVSGEDPAFSLPPSRPLGELNQAFAFCSLDA